MNGELLEVGVVVRSHGLRGQLKVLLHWADSEALWHTKDVFLELAGRRPERFGVEAVTRVPKGVLLSVRGIANREQADALRGARVSVARAQLPALGPDEYYLQDLLGATVSAPDGVVGKVVEIATYPSAEALVIRTAAGERLEQPLHEQWVTAIDVEAGRIQLSSRDGLL